MAACSDADDLTNCPVCFEEYDLHKRLPRMLLCVHTLCQECLATLIETTPGRIQCPECRKAMKIEARGVTAFQENKYIVSFLQRESERAKNSFLRCNIHNRELTHYCRENDCKELLCYRCQQSNHNFHNVVEIEDQQEVCNEAIAKVSQFIEEKKKELLMSKQLVTYYNDFAIGRIEKARKSFVDLVSTSFQDLKETCQKRTAQNCKILEDLMETIEKKSQSLQEIGLLGSSLDFDLIQKIEQSVAQAWADTNSISIVAYVNKQSTFADNVDDTCGKLVDIMQDLRIHEEQSLAMKIDTGGKLQKAV